MQIVIDPGENKKEKYFEKCKKQIFKIIERKKKLYDEELNNDIKEDKKKKNPSTIVVDENFNVTLVTLKGK